MSCAAFGPDLSLVSYLYRLARGGRPAGQEIKGVLRWRAGLCCVGEDSLTGVAGKLQGFVREGQVTDDGVVQLLRACPPLAMPSQPSKNSEAFGFRKMKRAMFGGPAVSANTGA